MTLAMFTKAKMILQGLINTSPLAQQQSLLVQMIEEIEPQTRFCQYQLTRQKQEVPSEAALLAATDGSGQVTLAQIKTMIQELAATADASALSSETQVLNVASAQQLFFTWQGREHFVMVDRAKTSLLAAEEIRGQITTAFSRKDASDSIMILYSKLIGCYGEARSQVRNAIRTLTSSSESIEAGSRRDEMQGLESALQGAVLEVTLEKAKLVAETAFSRFTAAMERVASGKKAGKVWTFNPFLFYLVALVIASNDSSHYLSYRRRRIGSPKPRMWSRSLTQT